MLEKLSFVAIDQETESLQNKFVDALILHIYWANLVTIRKI